MSELSDKQHLFMRLLPRLIDRAHTLGFEVAGGELERPQATADYYASIGKGIGHSLHRLSLAIDLKLFRNVDADPDLEYLTDTASYAALGAFWKSLHPLCCWGGDFGDGNHFSITHEGIR